MYLGQHGDYSKDSRIAVTAAAASDLVSWIPPTVDPLILGIKRPSEVLYHQTILGAHSTIGQTDAWYSANFLAKRPRFMSASNLPTYPQRPGEKDCAHYMLTRTCKFGESCRFDHPIWVPEGGIPNWKEVPLVVTNEILPERPGVPDCPYFLKTERCKYGMKCKFNHPKNAFTSGASKSTDPSALPERPSEPMCSFYMKTGKCKFGATCKFHHPKNVPFTSTGGENSDVESNEVAATVGEKNYSGISVTPALYQNSKGLPIRLGEVDCPFYIKTGSCKYGVTCRYNHPDRSAFIPPAANLTVGAGNPSASLFQTIDPRFAQPLLGIGVITYPQRPGQTECDYYMKTGECKFGERCKFHHPIEWSGLTSNGDQPVNLTLSGLPRRQGAVQCPYYLRTGICKFGATCKFDHPPLEELVTAEAVAGAGT